MARTASWHGKALEAKLVAKTGMNRRTTIRVSVAGKSKDIVKTNPARLNLPRLRRLGNTIRLDGGEKFLRLVSENKARRRIEF